MSRKPEPPTPTPFVPDKPKQKPTPPTGNPGTFDEPDFELPKGSPDSLPSPGVRNPLLDRLK